MPIIRQHTEQMNDLLSELILKDVDDSRKKEIAEEILSLADQIKTHRNANDIVYVELWIQVDNDEEWEELRSWFKS